MKSIAILSTINTNIGDEFIRDGILSVLRDIRPDFPFKVSIFNKHKPWTFYPEGHPIRWAAPLAALGIRGWIPLTRALAHLPGNRFFKADITIQSGTPILWDGCSRSEWAGPFWNSYAFHTKRRAPLYNLGGGSCYSWSDPPDSLSHRDRLFAQRMVEASTLTTTRDPLAARLLSKASGRKIPIIPCPAFLAGRFHVPSPAPPEKTLLLNIMPRAGHFDYQQNISAEGWKKAVDKLITAHQPEYRIRFVCHSKDELFFARAHWPELESFRPDSPASYFQECQGAFAAVTNRLHAAVGLSGLSIPSLAVGTDTRMLMTRELGIPTLFAPEATPDRLLVETQDLLLKRDVIAEQLRNRREEVRTMYRELLSLQPCFSDI